MTQTDWLIIACLAFGWVSGLYLGWLVWRKKQLEYIEDKNT